MRDLDRLFRRLKRETSWHTGAVEEICKRSGYKVLGAGAFGVTIDCGHEVVKFYTLSDDGYNLFLDVVLSHPHGEHLPRIFWKRQISKTVAAVCMEKLKPLGRFHDVKKTYNLFIKMMDEQDIEGDEELVETADLLHASYHPIQELLDDEIFIGLDLHMGNAMARGETLVITDPFCS